MQLGAVTIYMCTFVLIACQIYNRHSIVEFGILNNTKMRVIHSKFGFWYNEKIYPIQSIKTTQKSIDILKNPEDLNQSNFYLKIENKRLPFLCNIKSQNSYMNIEKVITHFQSQNLIEKENS